MADQSSTASGKHAGTRDPSVPYSESKGQHSGARLAPARAFAVWLTGLPGSGKSTIAASLKSQLLARGVDAAVLESDELRKIFTPQPRYDDQERDLFYQQMAYVGALLVEHGVPVIFDATANRRAYRDRARQRIPRFLEVHVKCALGVCMARDPKGIYHKALESAAHSVPGLQTSYEAPGAPEIVIRGDQESPERAAARVVARLEELKYF